MERFIVREPRTGAEYPQGNPMMAFSSNSVGNNMIPQETMYFSGPFASEFPNPQQSIPQRNMAVNQNMDAQAQRSNLIANQNMGAQRNMGANQNTMGAQHSMGNIQDIRAQHSTGAQHNMGAIQNTMSAQHSMGNNQDIRAQHSTGAQHNMGANQNIMSAQHSMGNNQDMRAQHSTGAQHNMEGNYNMAGANQNMGVQHNIGAHQTVNSLRNMNGQHNMDFQHNISAQYNMGVPHNMNQQISQTFMAGQGSVSGIDPSYLSGFTDNSAQFIVSGQRMQRNATPINSFGTDYQNRSFEGIDRNKQRSFPPQQDSSSRTGSAESSRALALPKPSPQMAVRNNNAENAVKNPTSQPKKPNELDLLRNDVQNQIMTRADKLKALHKTGPRAFSGPVEKVLKWHKSLHDIGVLIFYEIVAKCVSVRPGDPGSKVLVVRDDSGPAMQVVYFEIDFLLPDLKPPCTVRVIGRMMAGTCRLQAFNVRPATGDDVATLPRRAAVAAHHVAKLCREYGSDTA